MDPNKLLFAARKAMAIAASGEPPPFPRGACRQVLSEFCNPGFPIHIATADNYKSTTLGELLPHAFDLSDSND